MIEENCPRWDALTRNCSWNLHEGSPPRAEMCNNSCNPSEERAIRDA